MFSKKSLFRLEAEGRRFYRKGAVKSFRKVPGPVLLPIIGNLWQYKLGLLNSIEYHKTLEVLHKKYGPLVKEKLGPLTKVHVFSPDDVKTLHGDEGKSPVIMPFQETALQFRKDHNLSLGLGNSNGDEWYRLRNAVRQLMLTPKSVNSYLPRKEEVCEDFIKVLQKKRNNQGQVPGLRNEIGKWIQESAAYVCFDKRLGFLEGKNEKLIDDLLTAIKVIFYYSGMLEFSYPFFKYVNTPKFKTLLHFEEFAHVITHNMTIDAINAINDLVDKKQLKDGQYSFLLTLLNRNDLSESEITSLTHNMLVDSLTMTTPAMLANLYCLSVNQEVQEKAYREISSVVKKGEIITTALLGRLPYIKAVVKETFRLYPIFFEVARILQKDTVLSGYLIPKDTYVSINLNVHFRNPEYFKEPDKFIPERWIRGHELHEESNHRVLTPFSVGPRACIGRRFAEQDLHTCLTKILQHFHLTLPSNAKHFDQIVNSSLYPKYPSEVQFLNR